MAKIEDKSFYVSITPYEHEGATYDVLNVAAGYRKGRGFYANIHAGWKTDWGGYGCTFDFSGNPLSDTIWVDVKDSPKNSQKTIDVMAGALELAKDDIAYLFDQRNWTELKRLMKDVALCGYTYTIEERMKELRRYPNGSTTSESETNNSNNSKSETTMAKNVNAQEYVGKVLVLGGGAAKYVIKSVNEDGTMFKAQYVNGAMTKDDVTLPLTQIETILKNKVGHFEGAADAEASATETTTATADEVEEVEEIVVEPAKTVKMEQPKDEPKKKSDKPKAKSEGRGKKSDVSHQPSDLKYETYTNKKGKVCAKIIGFGENDPAYVNAADLHGSATYERNKDGNKTFYLIFGPRYADAAKEVCDALNDGKALKDCQAIIDKATEERARQRDEWKQKREERKAAADAPKGKTYTEAEVADLLKRVIAGDAEAMRIVNELNKAA